MNHLTEEQLNEYLDNESSERAQIEAHLAECAECAARLTALKTLFAEIESLAELELTHPLREASQWDAARLTLPSKLPAPQVPRSLTLTVTLQAALALIAISFAAPLITRFLAPLWQAYPIPSLRDALVELQMNFVMWIQTIQSFQLPTIPTGIFTLPKEISVATLSIGMIGIFVVWIIGNWWLLRKRPNSFV